MKKLLFIILALALLIPAASYAARVRYEVIDVQNGGIVTGKITTSAKPVNPVIPVIIKTKGDPKDTELEKQVCTTVKQPDVYILSSANEVKNVLVIVEKIKKGKAKPKQDLTIENVNCMFTPLVGISYVQTKYIIKNRDPLLHNTNLGKILGGGRRRTVYNLALPNKGQVIIKASRVSGLINVKCDAHPWMRAYVYGSRHPYVAITGADGSYEIKDLPPGNYTLRFWHEGFEPIVQDIEVKTGAVHDVNITFNKTVTPTFLQK